MKNISFLAFLLIFIFVTPAYAQTVENFSDEGLGDEDLTVDLAAEALPTTDAVSYWWENFRGNVISVFTFNAEKKAARMRLRLHRLDRKLAACAELGDEECVAKVAERTQALQDRTERYIAKRQELQAQHQQRFAEWRARRAAKAQALHQRAAGLRSQRQELLQQRQESRQQAIENRRQGRQSTIEQRRQNREQLIEMRSQNLKDKLDATRQ
ncbi:MAG: hypothetical protein ABIH36_04180 [bacterium]